MQINTGYDVTLILKISPEQNGHNKDKKQSPFEQFDGTIIRVMGTFIGTFEILKKNALK